MKRAFYWHLAFWLVLIFTFTISQWKYNNTLPEVFTFVLLFIPIQVIAVYVNWHYFIPNLLYKERFLGYFVSLALFMMALAILQRTLNLYWGYPIFLPQWADSNHLHVFKFTILVRHSLFIALPVVFTTAWRLFSEWKQKRENNIRLEKEKREAQLAYLKSQINPHFLFNTLNNIYSHSLEDSKKVPDLILKLSDFLSFSLYESNAQQIPLEKELSLMKDVIDLETSRFEDRVEVTTDISGDTKCISVPPLILLPFVENAFKHGLKDETNQAFINILLKVDKNHLYFKVKNSRVTGMGDMNRQNGLGIRNIRKRLDLLYGDGYTLNILDNKATFTVELAINTP